MIHQFVWGEPSQHYPWWIPSPSSLGEGIWGFFLFVLSLTIALISTLELGQIFSLTEENSDSVAGFLMMIFIAYGFHLRNLIFPKKPTQIKNEE